MKPPPLVLDSSPFLDPPHHYPNQHTQRQLLRPELYRPSSSASSIRSTASSLRSSSLSPSPISSSFHNSAGADTRDRNGNRDSPRNDLQTRRSSPYSTAKSNRVDPIPNMRHPSRSGFDSSSSTAALSAESLYSRIPKSTLQHSHQPHAQILHKQHAQPTLLPAAPLSEPATPVTPKFTPGSTSALSFYSQDFVRDEEDDEDDHGDSSYRSPETLLPKPDARSLNTNRRTAIPPPVRVPQNHDTQRVAVSTSTSSSSHQTRPRSQQHEFSVSCSSSSVSSGSSSDNQFVDFPFPSSASYAHPARAAANQPIAPASTTTGTHSHSNNITANLPPLATPQDFALRYQQQRRLSTSSSSSSIVSSHRLRTKASAPSLGGTNTPRNFSLYLPPTVSPTSSTTYSATATRPRNYDSHTDEPTGVAIDRPAESPPVNNDGSMRPGRTTSIPPPPPSSNDSTSMTSGMQRQNSMAITRRRTLGIKANPEAYAEALKKQRKQKEPEHKVLVGRPVDENHANYMAAYLMLTGIRVSVSRCNARVDRELTDEDFVAQHKHAFNVDGSELVPSSRYDFKFKDYSPWVFRHLRQLFKLDPADYLMSLTDQYMLSELSSPGKSGSFFYYSRDYRFIIKTLHHAEHRMLRKVLKEYHTHVKNNPNTLISQFYGLHRVKLPFGKKIHFVVMKNLFPAHHHLDRTYDLKGSSLGRLYKPPKVVDKDSKSEPVYKDVNWTEKGEALKLGPTKGQLLVEQLQRDVALLKRLNIMDYSLLIGIHNKKSGKPDRQEMYVFDPSGEGMRPNQLRRALSRTSPHPVSMPTSPTSPKREIIFYNDDGGFQATDGHDQPLDEIYYLGVIDCLTPYTFLKRIETWTKSLKHTRGTISAVPAQEYGERFFEFMKDAIQAYRPGATGREGPLGRDITATETEQLLTTEERDEQIAPFANVQQ